MSGYSDMGYVFTVFTVVGYVIFSY